MNGMDESRLVRCELSMEEASLLAELLKAHLSTGKDDDLANGLLARLQRAEDRAVDGTAIRGPANDGAEYEW
jgi:hypothetical protein